MTGLTHGWVLMGMIAAEDWSSGTKRGLGQGPDVQRKKQLKGLDIGKVR